MGNIVDMEDDGQPDANALGDDVNPPAADDEDGVSFLTPLVPGGTAQVEVRVTGNFEIAYLDAWVDFGRDGSWDQPGDRVFVAVPVSRGTHTLSFGVPTDARPGPSFARFRVSTVRSGLKVTGEAPDGEVEDYLVFVEESNLDFGDAPGKYPTLVSVNGARHIVLPGFCLGTWVDTEPDGQPDANAMGDDLNPPGAVDDEDGVFFLTPVVPGQSAQVLVTLTAPKNPNGGPGSGRLNAWVDFNRNETWADPGEQIFTNQLIFSGSNILSFWVPANARPGTTFARFRLNREGNVGFDGLAGDGEVEDYRVNIEQRLDFGDAPAPYPTLLRDDGARHVWSEFYMGSTVDIELDGQPTADADGDDMNPSSGPDDEDGVVFTSALVPGRAATVEVTVSDSGRLYAWVDFNRNGSWADPGEQVFADTPVSPGLNILSFNVPEDAVPGLTFSRWRYTVQGKGLSFVGLAPDGEVEDHPVRIIRDRERCDLGCEGREFWLTFPGNYAPDPTNPPQPALCIQGSAGTLATVTIPALGFVTNVSIPTNFVAWVALPAPADLGDFNDVVLPGRAVYVKATRDVRVVAFNHVKHTSDSYHALHVSTLGTEYRVLAWPNLHAGVPPLNGSQFAIVGTESNTVVTIVPSPTTVIKTPGVAYTVVLQPGDVYQLRDTNDAPADLTGTLIKATRPVAVFAGHACANVPTANQWYCDTLVEQLLPVNAWGGEYHLAPLASRSGGSPYRVLAAHDGTVVSVNGTPVATLNAGESVLRVAAGPARVEATRPVLVAHYAASSDWDGNPNADPFMALVQSPRHFTRVYVVCARTNDFSTHYVQLVVPTSVTNNVLVDGVPISPTLFQPIPGGSYAVANVPVGAGVHVITAPESFGMLSYGWALYDSYGHPGCFYFGDVEPPRVVTPVTHLTVDVTQNQQQPGFAYVPDLRAMAAVEDNCSTKQPRPQQEPVPGTALPPGIYSIGLYVVDDNGNVGQTNVTLAAVDPSPVTIQCPPDMVVPCDSVDGAYVQFSVRAFTRYETNVAVVSMPPSGSWFPIGTTIVTNIATSVAGKTATCTFRVTVVCDRKVTVQRTREGLVLSWPAPGVLEQAPSITGPWQPVPDATSPYVVRPTHLRMFYRVRY
ncbi:HYR domain-containing protein [Limisphaera ngatamarikiensis]|uniref:HYR domain-containing protein n=2 Tax=Limisphaera ngatamarikiensis TaxID=1324935 RepID=A0A6M1RU10_9BACT|nr:HYR domain-containing protein [Limisphaera ngatamarikiensis]